MTESRTRWYLRPLRLTVLTLVLLATAMIATVGGYAWRRNAAIAWIEGTGGTVVFGSTPEWLPDRWVESWPQWALPVESVELTERAAGDIHRLGVLREAKMLDLSQVPLTDAQLRHLSGFSEIMSLSIRGPDVTDAGIVPLLRYKSLTLLALVNTAISDKSVEHLAGHPLKSLDLSGTLVTDDCMDAIGSLTLLHTLFLDGTSVGDAGVEKLKGLPLQTLGLVETRVTDAGIAAIGPMPDLIWLHLDKTDVGDETLAIVGTWGMSNLTVSHTRITDAGLVHLNSRSLRMLDLAGTAISDAGLEQLHPKPGLGYLDLSGTRVTIPAARDFAKSHNLQLIEGRSQLTLSTPPSMKVMGGMGMF